MKALITGTTSGIGFHLSKLLTNWEIIELPRSVVDLDFPNQITSEHVNHVDLLINNAGHDLGGKVNFCDHQFSHWQKVLNTNLVSAMRLSQLAIQKNPNITILNITSTNIDKYWGNDLVYTLSKVALEHFGKMIKIDYPTVRVKEVRLGLTKTNFNNNRHKPNHKPIDNLYSNPCLDPARVAQSIVEFINSDKEFIRLSL